MFDLNLATIFSKVVENNSITGAAKALEIPKATVSRKISALEDELGVRLLQRTTRKLNLTDTGKIYYERCQSALNQLHEANLEASQIQEEPAGTIKIAAPVEFTEEILQQPIFEFLKKYPKINIKLEVSDRIVDMVSDNFDLAFRGGKLNDSTLIVRRLGATNQVLVASPNYINKEGTPKHPKDYNNYQTIGHNSDMNNHSKFTNGKTSFTFKLKPRFAVNSLLMMRDSAIAGLGITVLPCFLAIEALRKGQLVILLPEWKYHFGDFSLVYPSKQHMPERIRLFIDYIMNNFDTEKPWLTSKDELKQYIHKDYKTKDGIDV